MKNNRLLLAALILAGATQTTLAQDIVPQQSQAQSVSQQQQAQVYLLPPQPNTYNEEASDDLEATVQCDFVSHYMWRGTDMGGISIQPTASIGWRGLSLSFFGNTGLDKEDAEEIDVTLGYERDFGEFTLNAGLTDYWTSGMDYNKLDRYFFFEQAESAHQLEANIGVTWNNISLQAYTMVWGNDFKYQNQRDAEFRVNGKHAFSTFIELGYPFYAAGLDWDVKAGVTPFESACTFNEDGVKEYYYADKTAWVMASVRATKNFELGDVKMPVFAELHTNPHTRQAHFLIGFSVIPFR